MLIYDHPHIIFRLIWVHLDVWKMYVGPQSDRFRIKFCNTGTNMYFFSRYIVLQIVISKHRFTNIVIIICFLFWKNHNDLDM